MAMEPVSMQREVGKLGSTRHDVLIVGGGIYGAALAREAATRGLRTALIEQADFCSGSSANSLKIIHGGLRYLQQADLPRVWQSARERSILLRTAPHLVTPLPCIMPTRGHGTQSRAAMTLGLLANDLLTWNRNRALDPRRRIPNGRTLSRAELLQLLPGLEGEPVTGGAQWTDALALDTERLVIAMLQAAVQAGALVANYLQAQRFLMEGRRVIGVQALDRIDGASVDIHANLVIHAAGAWPPGTLGAAQAPPAADQPPRALAVNLLLKNWPVSSHAVGLPARANRRLYFFVPWRGITMAGTYYRPFTGAPETLTVTETDIDAYLNALNSCLPGVTLTRADILAIHAGVLPCRRPMPPDQEPDLLRHHRYLNHATHDGRPGLISVLGSKYTTARAVAETVIDKLPALLGKPLPPSTTAHTPLPGGNLPDLASFEARMATAYPNLPAETRRRLTALYGSDADAILSTAFPPGTTGADADSLLRAELQHVLQREMPQTLGDLLYRRTGIATAGPPDPALIHTCAEVMAAAHHWGPNRRQAELTAVQTAPSLWQAACVPPALQP